MSLTQRKHFLQDVFQMIAMALVSVINHYHINRLHLFWDTLYDKRNQYSIKKNFKKNKKHAIMKLFCLSNLPLITYFYIWLVTQFSQLGCKICQLHLCRGVRQKPLPAPMSVLDMALNCIWWWGSSSGALENVEYLFIANTPRSTDLAYSYLLGSHV